jgi:hypothetical protein
MYVVNFNDLVTGLMTERLKEIIEDRGGNTPPIIYLQGRMLSLDDSC